MFKPDRRSLPENLSRERAKKPLHMEKKEKERDVKNRKTRHGSKLLYSMLTGVEDRSIQGHCW